MNEQFYSQFGEDKWLIENHIVDANKKGFFLDIGAGDWKNLSNTLYLEEHGWDGVCVDAEPRQLPGLLEHRKNVVFGLISDRAGLMPFYMNNATPDISRIIPEGNEKRVVMPSFTFEDLRRFYAIKEIDLLSIDIEGHESIVLDKIFEHAVFPKIIIVEYLVSGISHADEIHSVFMARPYKKIHTTTSNFIYQYEN